MKRSEHCFPDLALWGYMRGRKKVFKLAHFMCVILHVIKREYESKTKNPFYEFTFSATLHSLTWRIIDIVYEYVAAAHTSYKGESIYIITFISALRQCHVSTG